MGAEASNDRDSSDRKDNTTDRKDNDKEKQEQREKAAKAVEKEVFKAETYAMGGDKGSKAYADKLRDDCEKQTGIRIREFSEQELRDERRRQMINGMAQGDPRD
jgi:hypothetical protein